MNRYLMVCRLRWPALLLLTGVIALLHQMDILTWGHAWPLYLILFGVLALAERAALATDPDTGDYPYAPGYGAPGFAGQPGGYPGNYQGAPAPAPVQQASTGIVPAQTDLELRLKEEDAERRKGWEEEGR
jgi:hypothetical protein